MLQDFCIVSSNALETVRRSTTPNQHSSPAPSRTHDFPAGVVAMGLPPRDCEKCVRLRPALTLLCSFDLTIVPAHFWYCRFK